MSLFLALFSAHMSSLWEQWN